MVAQDNDEITVVVNGERRVVGTRDLTYQAVVHLAFPDVPLDPDTTFTVLYRKAEQSRAEGSMVPGSTVKVHKQGTSFNVTRSIRS